MSKSDETRYFVAGADDDVTIDVETILPVTIGILGTVFVGSLVVLLVVCRRRYCRSSSLDPDIVVFLAQHSRGNRPDNANLVDDVDCCHLEEENGECVELDVGIANRDLDSLMADEVWVNDASDVTPHCLAILKVVHQLTERLVSANLHQLQTAAMMSQQTPPPPLQSPPETLVQLVSVARRIGPRVDDVVNALYPPLDPRLLEARCSALVLSVNHLVLLTKNVVRLTTLLDWVDQSLADVDDHLQVLRTASVAYELALRTLNSSSQTSINSTTTINSSSRRRSTSVGAQDSPAEISCSILHGLPQQLLLADGHGLALLQQAAAPGSQTVVHFRQPANQNHYYPNIPLHS
jgi:hypothetical protein